MESRRYQFLDSGWFQFRAELYGQRVERIEHASKNDLLVRRDLRTTKLQVDLKRQHCFCNNWKSSYIVSRPKMTSHAYFLFNNPSTFLVRLSSQSCVCHSTRNVTSFKDDLLTKKSSGKVVSLLGNVLYLPTFRRCRDSNPRLSPCHPIQQLKMKKYVWFMLRLATIISVSTVVKAKFL